MSRASISVWDRAAAAADLTILLPRKVPMFFRRIPKSPAEGFRMGSRGHGSDEEPVHRVVIRDDFYLGTFVVTQQQYAAVAGQVPELRDRAKPSSFKGGRRPVEQVDRREANRFCAWLTAHFPAAQLPPGCRLFCLPTEAEWEHACRAGTDTGYYSGDGEAALREVGWFDDNSGSETHPVDERPESHPWGLHGMHGNVWEWCHELYAGDAYRCCMDGEADPGFAPRSDDWRSGIKAFTDVNDYRDRVVRGGSWGLTAGGCRSAYRVWRRPDDRVRIQGFRVCLVRGPADEGGAREQPAPATAAAGVGGRGTRPETDAAKGAGADPDLAHATFPRAAGRDFLRADRPDETPPSSAP